MDMKNFDKEEYQQIANNAAMYVHDCLVDAMVQIADQNGVTSGQHMNAGPVVQGAIIGVIIFMMREGTPRDVIRREIARMTGDPMLDQIETWVALNPKGDASKFGHA